MAPSACKTSIWLFCFLFFFQGCSSSSDPKGKLREFIRGKHKSFQQAYSFEAVAINPQNNFISIFSGEYQGIEQIATHNFVKTDTSLWNVDLERIKLLVGELNDKNDGNQELLGYNHEYRFVLGERNDGTKFIRNLKDRQEFGFSYGVSAFHFSIANWGLSLLDLVDDPRVTIIKFVKTEDQDEGELNVVEGEFLGTNGAIKFTLFLDSLTQFVKRLMLSGSRIEVKYKDIENVAIPELIDFWNDDNGSSKLDQRIYFLNQVPIENFESSKCRLAFYGINSPYDAPKRWFSSVSMVLIVISTIALLIILFWARKKYL